MHRIFTAITILLLVGGQAAWAVRVLEQVESSYELSLADATLPLSSSGSVTFKACSECNTEAVPVTPSTSYFLVKQKVSLAQFNEQARLMRAQPGVAARTMLMLHYDIDTKRATRLVLETFPAR
jgi:hypothetical protein